MTALQTRSSKLPLALRTTVLRPAARVVMVALPACLWCVTAARAADGESLAERSVQTQRQVADTNPHATLEVDARPPAVQPALIHNTAVSAARDDVHSDVHMQYVQWAPVGAATTMGLTVGVGSVVRPGAAGALPTGVDPQRGALAPEIGVRFRSQLAGQRRLDVGAWSAYDANLATPADQRRSYNARVELQFKNAKAPVAFSRGALGMQVSASAQMLLRTKRGGPMVYYRSNF